MINRYKNKYDDIIKSEGNYFEFYSYNLKCYGKRVEDFGSWNGYIEIPFVHDFYKVCNDTIYSLEVHGGITYIDKDDKKLIIGFDANHYTDIIPYMYIMFPDFINEYSTYKDKKFIENELRNLSTQIYNLYPDFHNKIGNIFRQLNQ